MTFQWPYLLFSLALIPLLCVFYLLAQRRRRTYAVRFTNLALLTEVVGRTPGLRRHIPPLLFLLGLAALCISLARPMAVIAIPRDQTTVMLVLDVSGSMAATDLQPNRLTAAQEAAHAFVDSLPPNFQVGLVSFNEHPYINVPPTHDRALLQRAIAQLRPFGGTAIGEGLHLALDQVAQRSTDKDAQQPPSVVVLLSDGQSQQGRPPESAAARAAGEQVRVYTVGIGQRGETVFVQGRPAFLDEATLQMIASETGGEYFYAAETDTLEQIYADLGSQISWVEEHTEVTALASGVGTLLLLASGLLSLRWFQQLP
jgi:Ca-activated chloride channel family protein